MSQAEGMASREGLQVLRMLSQDYERRRRGKRKSGKVIK